MNIYTKPGQFVKFANPKAGFHSDQEKSAKLLTEGALYEVERTEVESWYTRVYLRDFPGEVFNSVQFDDVQTHLGEGQHGLQRRDN